MASFLYALSAGIVVVLSSLQLSSSAEEPKRDSSDKATPFESPGADDRSNDETIKSEPESTQLSTRPMTIRVRDENGVPIASAKITVAVWLLPEFTKPKGFQSTRYSTTNENGSVGLEIPKELRILRLWAFRIQASATDCGIHQDRSRTVARITIDI